MVVKRSNRAKLASVPDEVSTQLAYPKNDQDFMLSLARGLSVINCFSEERKSLTMAEVSETAGIPRAVARRCLHTLKLLGYVSLHERQYSLRPKVLKLGHTYLASAPLAKLAEPYLQKMVAALNESCSIATLDGEMITYIARCASNIRIMSVDLKIGSELPAIYTSMGRILLAHRPASSLDAILAKTKLVKHTAFTITDPMLLRAVLGRCRKHGYSLVDQELELGLRSIAVPIRDTMGNVVAALNVGVNAARYTKSQLKDLTLPVLKAISHEIGGLLVQEPG